MADANSTRSIKPLNVTPISDGWAASLWNPRSVKKANPLIGLSVEDTLCLVAAALAYISRIDPGLHPNPDDDEDLGEEAVHGRCLALNIIMDTAIDALHRQEKQLEHDRTRRRDREVAHHG